MINQTRAKCGAHKAAAVWERLGTCAWLRLFLELSTFAYSSSFFNFISFHLIFRRLTIRVVIEKNIEHFYWMDDDAIGWRFTRFSSSSSSLVLFSIFIIVTLQWYARITTSNHQRIMWSNSFSNLAHSPGPNDDKTHTHIANQNKNSQKLP